MGRYQRRGSAGQAVGLRRLVAVVVVEGVVLLRRLALQRLQDAEHVQRQLAEFDLVAVVADDEHLLQRQVHGRTALHRRRRQRAQSNGKESIRESNVSFERQFFESCSIVGLGSSSGLTSLYPNLREGPQ